MVTQDLIEAVITKFQQGATRQEVEDELGELGWQESDIDAAIHQIQHAALLQLPIISDFHNILTRLDAQTSQWPVPIILGMCGLLIFVIFLIAIVLYNSLDPLGTNAGKRDGQREAAMNQINDAIVKYNMKLHHYPASLSDLAPTYIASIPKDPKTGEPYDYRSTDNLINYELCAHFETQSVQCVSSSPDSAIPVVTPTDIPLGTPVLPTRSTQLQNGSSTQ